MSLSKRSPDLLLDNVTQFGLPWHGRIDHVPYEANPSDWRITLPNDEEKLAPFVGKISAGLEVSGAWRYPEACGFNSLFARPDMPPVTRSAAQLAQDEAAGREWRNTAIIHRPEFMASSPNWIWCDSTGVRWLVAAWFKSTELEVRLRRFGAFGSYSSGEVLTKIYPHSLAMAGQDSALPSPYSLAQLRYRLHDRTPIGDRAVVMLHLLPPSSTYDRPLKIDRMASGSGERYLITPLPCGFLEVSMSGTPESGDWDASVSVIAGRAATLGAVTETVHGNDMRRFQVTITYDPPSINEAEGLAVTQTVTASGADIPDPLDAVNSILMWDFTRGKLGVEVSVSNRILSMHYEGGVLVTVTCDWAYKEFKAEDSAFSVDGTAYRYYSRPTTGSSWTFLGQDGGVFLNAAYTATTEWSESFTLRKDGVAFSSWSSGRFDTISKSARHLFLPGFTGLSQVSESHSGGRDFVTNGATLSPPVSWGTNDSIYGYSSFNAGPDFSYPGVVPAAMWLWGPLTGRVIPGAPIVDAGDTSRWWTRNVVYYSQCCIGYVARGDESTATSTAMDIGAVSTPEGAEASIPRTLYSLENRPPVFASYNPVTGEFARSPWPVNWA